MCSETPSQERGHHCSKASATEMSLKTARLWEGAAGDPEKHTSCCMQAVAAAPCPDAPPAPLRIPHERYLKGQPEQGASVSEHGGRDNSAHDFCKGLDPCSQGSARSEQTTPLIPLMDLLCDFTSWPHLICNTSS